MPNLDPRLKINTYDCTPNQDAIGSQPSTKAIKVKVGHNDDNNPEHRNFTNAALESNINDDIDHEQCKQQQKTASSATLLRRRKRETESSHKRRRKRMLQSYS